MAKHELRAEDHQIRDHRALRRGSGRFRPADAVVLLLIHNTFRVMAGESILFHFGAGTDDTCLFMLENDVGAARQVQPVRVKRAL